jgi:hypothetical protein
MRRTIDDAARQAVRDAVEAERRADVDFNARKERLDCLLTQLRRSGVSFELLAKLVFATQRRRKASKNEQLRESARLRKRLSRVTPSHKNRAVEKGHRTSLRVALGNTEDQMTNDPRLIKRTTVEETFARTGDDDLADADLGEDEDIDGDEDGDDRG